MKLLTINTHSIIEPDYEKKLDYFIGTIAKNPPDIIAMQEVNQSVLSELADDLPGFMPCISRMVREDNHVLRVVRALYGKGISYNWTWVPIKLGYGRFEEGLSFMSRYPIIQAKSIYISTTREYSNFKTRRLLGISTGAGDFYNVHMGWWNDEEEPFLLQWQRADEYINGKAWLMGDFNSPDDVRNEGYDAVIKSGWYDLCRTGCTVAKKIDGWEVDKKQRLDYIFCNFKTQVEYATVVFDGKNGEEVSDHFGVWAKI